MKDKQKEIDIAAHDNTNICLKLMRRAQTELNICNSLTHIRL